MNWMITVRKFFQAAVAGAIVSVGSVSIAQNDPNYWGVLITAVALGAISGAVNAWKHADDPRRPEPIQVE